MVLQTFGNGMHRTKLIEVALPLDAINEESERDKKLSSGHPTTLHYWWAPRPLAACRAVVFSSLVDDPSAHPDRFPDEESQRRERERLFALLTELVKWESRRDSRVLEAARAEIMKSTGGKPPVLLDPFAGRGLIPLEGQRLGLDVIAADLNPVAVVIERALLTVLPSFLNCRAVNPDARQLGTVQEWSGTSGFVADVEYYSDRVVAEAKKRIGFLFPEYEISDDLCRERGDLRAFRGKKLPIFAWIWARTMTCSNPACRFLIPLVGSYWLAKKAGKKAWIDAQPGPDGRPVFSIRTGAGAPAEATKVPGTSGSFRCPACQTVSDDRYTEEQGRSGKIGSILMACIVDGGRAHGRIYLPPTEQQSRAAFRCEPDWYPDYPLPDYSQALPTAKHGVFTWGDLFTKRQLVTLSSLADQVRSIHAVVERDAVHAGLSDDGIPLEDGGRGATAYADAVTTFLGMILGRYVNRSSSFCFYDSGGAQSIQQPFSQQGIQKTWDFAEGNPFSSSSGSWQSAANYPIRVAKEVYANIRPSRAIQQSVDSSVGLGGPFLIVTDPPYYDNMGYADLSDFFYIWLRRALKDVYPDLFSTVLTPKDQELAAVRHRFGGDRDRAENFFVDGFDRAFAALARVHDSQYPLCLFYAYKQRESKKGGLEASTGWETMLRGLIENGYQIVGTWPMLSESTDTIKKQKSSLSTSVVLVCRIRDARAGITTRRQFLTELKAVLPQALRAMQDSNIAPADLAQAAIGPGMSVYSKYAKVVEADGTPMSVRAALQHINQVLDEALTQSEGDFDADTRWALSWFDQFGMEAGPYGTAEKYATARNIAVDGLQRAGLIAWSSGQVRLLSREELDPEWNPSRDRRLTVWEVTQHLIRTLERHGEARVAELVAALGGLADVARDLAYRLYNTSDKKGWTKEAVAYNALVVAWPEIIRLARGERAGDVQRDLGI